MELVQKLKATTRGPNRYTDIPIDIPNYLNMHGYFNSELGSMS